MMTNYDSKGDTHEHIQKVQRNISTVVMLLIQRGMVHDQSKLESPEKEHFDRLTPMLATLPYGSEEYKASLAELKPALDHHYANNSHHPEYYKDGIDGMDLMDVVEMLCDWKAATERTKDGDLRRSLEINKDRFKMSEQLYQIMLNTATRLGWIK